MKPESAWTVDSRGDFSRLTLLSSDLNVAVERAVVWSSATGAQVFGNNRPFPEDNILHLVLKPDHNDLTGVSEYLQNWPFF